MSDAADRGITVNELAAMDQPIDVLRETAAAFVGRALRGPINEPVLVSNIAEFNRCFGDNWSRSSLGPAVQLFFEYGGRKLYVVRVANNARGALLCLPASGSALVLRAIDPGSTECIRAAVDYDGIDAANDELFNLTLQRLDPRTDLVVDQELYRRCSYQSSSPKFIADQMLNSGLARVESPLPMHRPEATALAAAVPARSYVGAAQAGTDGHELSDYDLIGSRKQETGLFALEQIPHFDLLYLPPPGKHRDLGVTAVLAAERYCRARGAMLLLDPPRDWQTPQQAVDGVHDLGYSSPNVCSYFPRLRHRDDPAGASRVAAGALAGMLCRMDREFGAWRDFDLPTLRFRRELLPLAELDAAAKQALLRAGLNVLCKADAGAVRVQGSVTMGRASSTAHQFASIGVMRCCLRIVNAIDAATRWAVFATHMAGLADRIRAQVHAYFLELAELGAFANDSFIVECDAGLRKDSGHGARDFSVYVAFQPLGALEPLAFTIHQSVAGSRIARTAFAPGIRPE